MIFSVGFALTHDAVCHEGGGEASVKYLSVHEHEHGHGAHGHGETHEQSEKSGHQSDHHDDIHDHQLRPLLAKREVSEQQRVGCIQIAMVTFVTAESLVAAGLANIYPVNDGAELSLPVGEVFVLDSI